MSEQAVEAWARACPVPTASHRLLLIVMASLCDSHNEAITTLEELSELTLLSPRQLRRLLSDLEAKDTIRREYRRRVSGVQGATRFSLNPPRLSSVENMNPKKSDRRTKCPPVNLAVYDATTNSGLHDLLEAVACHGWTADANQALGVAAQVQAQTRMGWLARRRYHMGFATAIDDIASRMWQVVHEESDRIRSADNPWGLTATITSKRIAEDDRELYPGVEIVTETYPESFELDQSITSIDEVSFDDVLSSDGAIAHLVMHVCKAGLPETIAWRAVRRCLEIAVKHGASRRITYARADGDLADLGLSQDAITALMNLCCGTRRGGEELAMLYRISRGGTGITATEKQWLTKLGRAWVA